jgi:hypothetical protein
MTQHSMFSIETVAPKIRNVTFSNPPVNLVGAGTVAQLIEVLDKLSRAGTSRFRSSSSPAVRPDTSSTTPTSAR